MYSVRTVARVAVGTVVGVVLSGRVAGAQSCAIATTSRGPVSCSIATTLSITTRMPALVGVSVTPGSASVAGASRRGLRGSIDAGIGVRANRSYSLQIARGSMDSRPATTTSGTRITWSTDNASALLGDVPMAIGEYAGRGSALVPLRIAFERDAAKQHGTSSFDPINLLLTVVAP